MKNLLKMAGAVALMTVPMHVNAATGNIPFNGSVADTCVVTVTGSGTLAASTDFAVLGSEEAGGAAGTASLLTTGGSFSLSADAPASFSSAPATGNDNVSFEANYSATGANTIAQTDGGTATALARGNTNVSINMSSSKTVGGETFEAGSYTATVVLCCE